MNCDAIHQMNTCSITSTAAATNNMIMEDISSSNRQEAAAISTALREEEERGTGEATRTMIDLNKSSSSSSSSSSVSSSSERISLRCDDGHDEHDAADDEEDDDDDGPGDVPQKMGLVRFMELNNNSNNSNNNKTRSSCPQGGAMILSCFQPSVTTLTRTSDDTSKSESDSDDDIDEEESIDVFNAESVAVVSPLIQNPSTYTFKPTSSDEMLRRCSAKNILDTTEHTVSESSSSSSSSSSSFMREDFILEDPVEPSRLSSWQSIRSNTAAAAAAASAVVLATATAASKEVAPPPLFRVASDNRIVHATDDPEEHRPQGQEPIQQLKNLKRHCLLGEGFLGKVWLVSDSSTSTAAAASTRLDQPEHRHEENSVVFVYALKRLSKYDLLNEDLIDAVIRERDLLQSMHHAGIVRLVASFQDANYVYLLQDYCPGGELFSLLAQQHQPKKGANATGAPPPLAFSEDASRFYTACLTDALWYMHVQKRVVYRDLKPENVMLDRLGYPILVDFGHARQLAVSRNSSENDEQQQQQQLAYTLCGTPKFVAPEMIQGIGHGFAVDYWSLGIILYQMLSTTTSSDDDDDDDDDSNSNSNSNNNHQRHPFQYDDDMDDFTLYEAIVQDEYMPLNRDTVSPEAADLIDGLLKKDPKQRLGAVDESATHNGVLQHAFFTNKVNIRLLRRRLIPAPWVPRLHDALDASHFDDFEHINNSNGSNNGHDDAHHHGLGMSSLHLSLRDQEKFANF
jgi:protein kinase A